MDIRSPLTQQVAPSLLSGVVTRVDADTGRVDVDVFGPMRRTFRDCEIASSVKMGGLGGLDFKAVVGAHCILVENLSTSPGGISASPIVLAFRSLTTEARSTRTELVPGDIRVQGVRGNDLLLRNNGDVYLLSDQQTALALLSTEELVRLSSPSYAHTLAGGSVRWMVSADDLGGPVAYRMGIKEFASDAEPYLSVTAGAEADGGLNVALYRQGAARGDAHPAFVNLVDAGAGFSFDVTNSGAVSVCAAESLSLESIGPVSVLTPSSVEVSGSSVQLSGNGASLTIGADGVLRIVAPAGIEMSTSALRVTDVTHAVHTADASEDSKRLANIDLFPWLFTHTHPTPMGMSLAPLGGPEDGGAPSEAETEAAITAMRSVTDAFTALLTELAVALPPLEPLVAPLVAALELYALSNQPAQVVNSRDEVSTKDTRAR